MYVTFHALRKLFDNNVTSCVFLFFWVLLLSGEYLASSTHTHNPLAIWKYAYYVMFFRSARAPALPLSPPHVCAIIRPQNRAARQGKQHVTGAC